jgi:hypothetical protein
MDFQLMRTALALSAIFLVGAGRPASASLSDRDFQQLMNAAVASSSAPSELQPLTKTICIQRELQPPLVATKGWIKTFEDAGKDNVQPRTGDADADRSLTAAMSSKPVAPRQTRISLLPKKFVVVGKAFPPECVIPHSLVRGRNWQRDESIVVLTFTRPALANGYAFIENYEECSGLCGTTFLRVFRKQKGKWTQVARTILSVS